MTTASITSRQTLVSVARVVCHELSHQWFGNVVTMDWWTGLWLKEGFAQYMEFDTVHALFPEWSVWDTFVQQIHMDSAFSDDSLVTSHPIEVEAKRSLTPSRTKKGRVSRMLADLLGRNVFCRGVHQYLVNYSYKNTKTEDLWDALEKASGIQIMAMANSWTKQTGFPLVTAEMSPENNGLTIKQERFFSDFDEKPDDATLWDVPLTLITSLESNIQPIGIWDAHSELAQSTTATPLVANVEVNQLVRAAVPEGVWFKINPNQSNFYLVNYPSVVWKQLQDPIMTRSLSKV